MVLLLSPSYEGGNDGPKICSNLTKIHSWQVVEPGSESWKSDARAGPLTHNAVLTLAILCGYLLSEHTFSEHLLCFPVLSAKNTLGEK